jgi:hypothetical protein
MSISGILSSSSFHSNSPSFHDRMQQFRKDFQQLGQDLQTGNLSGAQADFAALQKDGPQSSASARSSRPIAQAFQPLSTDLQSGNRTAAQQDDANLQQDFQIQASQMQRPHHHPRMHFERGRLQRRRYLATDDAAGSEPASGRPCLGPAGLYHAAAGSAAVGNF